MYNKQAVTLAIAVLMGSGFHIQPVLAQAVTGGLNGSVIVKKKALLKGEVRVTVRNLGTGLVNKRKVGRKGQYSFHSLPTGHYAVTVTADGSQVGVPKKVYVTAGTSTGVPVIGATTLGVVHVQAQSAVAGFINPIDTTTPELTTTVTAQLMTKLALSRSAKTVADQFLSNVSTVGTGLPRFNGATGATNRYYVNGFDATRGTTDMDLHGIPGEAMATEQVIGDTATARYSNAMGGTLSQVVKQGTNRLEFGYDLSFEPPTSKLLRPHGRNYSYPDGSWYHYNNGHASANFTHYL